MISRVTNDHINSLHLHCNAFFRLYMRMIMEYRNIRMPEIRMLLVVVVYSNEAVILFLKLVMGFGTSAMKGDSSLSFNHQLKYYSLIIVICYYRFLNSRWDQKVHVCFFGILWRSMDRSICLINVIKALWHILSSTGISVRLYEVSSKKRVVYRPQATWRCTAYLPILLQLLVLYVGPFINLLCVAFPFFIESKTKERSWNKNYRIVVFFRTTRTFHFHLLLLQLKKKIQRKK